MVQKRLPRRAVSLPTRLTIRRNDENAAKVSGVHDIFASFPEPALPWCLNRSGRGPDSTTHHRAPRGAALLHGTSQYLSEGGVCASRI